MSGDSRSLLDGKTLGEKRYGAGHRPERTHFVVLVFDHCSTCSNRCEFTMEVFVDDRPPGTHWFAQLLAKTWDAGYQRAWVTLGFCAGHAQEAMQLALEVQTDTDLWAPGRENPYVFPHPLKPVKV